MTYSLVHRDGLCELLHNANGQLLVDEFGEVLFFSHTVIGDCLLDHFSELLHLIGWCLEQSVLLLEHVEGQLVGLEFGVDWCLSFFLCFCHFLIYFHVG